MKSKIHCRGKFIVIEGTDGSGKTTQIKLLSKRLRREGVSVVTVDFPQYGKKSAYFVEKYLRGEYGSANDVGPYRASIFYALDRYEKSFEIQKWLSEGKVVISNRYVSANMGHQAGKLNGNAREKFLKWVVSIEYDIFGIPKPDATILLYVDPAVAQRFVDLKGKRKYTKGKKRDIHEADLFHLQKAAEAYRQVARDYYWQTIDCMVEKKVLSISDVHEKIYAKVKTLLKF